jgi:hypothetical protein
MCIVMSEERVDADEVDRYWDAWALTGRSRRTETLDLATQDLIDHLWRVGAPPQAAAARTRVWQRLRYASKQEEHPMDTASMAAVQRLPQWSPGRSNSRVPARTSPFRMRPGWRGFGGLVATSALVVLMLTAGLFVAGPLRPAGVATEPAGGPALVLAPATPGPKEAAREVLVETTVPAAALPVGEDRFLHISQVTMQPGVVVTIPAEEAACCPGPLMDHVLAGELTIRVEGPLRVARAATGATPGPVEEVAPGTAVVLRAGDTALYDQALSTEYANHGTEPVQLVGGGLFLGRPQVSPPGLKLNNFDSMSSLPLPAGPVTFVLEQVMLEPRAMLPSPPPGALRVLTSGPQIAYLPKAADGSVTNLTRDPIEAYVLTVLPAGAGAGPLQATPTT